MDFFDVGKKYGRCFFMPKSGNRSEKRSVLPPGIMWLGPFNSKPGPNLK